MRTLLLTSFLLGLVLGLAPSAEAQPTNLPSYAEIELKRSDVEAATVTGPAPVYKKPTTESEFVGRLASGDSVLVYELARMQDSRILMYGIATLENGIIGYTFPHHLSQEIQDRWDDRDLEVYEEERLESIQESFAQKSPARATLLGILVPGGGHLYAGETGPGLFMLLSSGTALGFGVGFMVSSEMGDCGGFDCLNQTKYAFLTIGSIYTLVAWSYGLSDAGDAARRHNVLQRFAELESGPVEVGPKVGTHGGEEAYGISATLRF